MSFCQKFGFNELLVCKSSVEKITKLVKPIKGLFRLLKCIL